MSTGDALFAAILENPDDDLVRLVYADWLDENGDPERAELIRVQIELTHLPKDHPDWMDVDGRRKLLLAANRTRWLGDRVKVAPNTAWVFRRGFPDELDLGRERIGDIGVAALASSAHVSQIASLDLTGNRLSVTGMRAVCGSVHFSRLSQLTLDGNEIGGEGARVIAESPQFVRLSRLSLRGCRIGIRGAMALASGKVLSQLTRLGLWSNDIGDAGVAALVSSPQVSRLTALDVGGSELTDEGAFALANSPHLTNLVELDIGCNYDIGPAGAEALHARFGGLVRNSLIDILRVQKRRAWDEADWEEEALSSRGKHVEAVLAKFGVPPGVPRP